MKYPHKRLNLRGGALRRLQQPVRLRKRDDFWESMGEKCPDCADAALSCSAPATGSVPKWIQLKLREAVRLIHNEDDYYGGMDIVADLAGLSVDKLETKPTTLAEISEQNKEITSR